MTNPKTANRPEGSPTKLKTFKRRRCQNCNKLYTPTREDQKFCRELPDKDKCRKEFYRYGSSYGPLKTGLHKAIDKKYAELAKVIDGRNKAIVIQFREVFARLDALRDEHEGHVHECGDDLTQRPHAVVVRERASNVERILSDAKTKAR